jgi:hypothetical protein
MPEAEPRRASDRSPLNTLTRRVGANRKDSIRQTLRPGGTDSKNSWEVIGDLDDRLRRR